MTKPPEKSKVVRKLRCAVYTRKSSEEGLEQEFNSLHAQREACEARLLREWQGVEQIVTVTADGFEWQGRPYKSLSAIARAITGTRWNGWVFFGLKNHRGRT